MSESVFERIGRDVSELKIDISEKELAIMAEEKGFSLEQLEAIAATFDYLRERKEEIVINTLLKMSRLPLTEPKTFGNFDFSRISGKDSKALKTLPSLTEVHAGRNIAFIGPPGIGKTHLSKAVGYECCMKKMKSYFLKATELNDRLTTARRFGREDSVINGLVKPTCLIIDEVGRCVFGKENTRMFFDMVDRRYNKEGPNTMIFTSNMTPDKWSEYFNEDDSLLCALDRIFDNAKVFMIKGESYRGRKRETFAIEAGTPVSVSKN